MQQQQQIRFQTNLIQAQNPILQDNITKTKNLLISLNCALNNIFESAAQYVSSEENRNPEDNSGFDKHLEEFYSICDQIEVNLHTALKCIKQLESSRKHLPLPVTILPQPSSMTYDEYLKTVQAQVDFHKDIMSIFNAED